MRGRTRIVLWVVFGGVLAVALSMGAFAIAGGSVGKPAAPIRVSPAGDHTRSPEPEATHSTEPTKTPTPTPSEHPSDDPTASPTTETSTATATSSSETPHESTATASPTDDHSESPDGSGDGGDD